MKCYPRQIEHLGNSRYRVRIDSANTEGGHVFEFQVTGDDIRVVEASQEFDMFLKHNFAPAKNLMAAILALDMSLGFEIADSNLL